MCFSLRWEHRSKSSWREDDEVGMGCFEFEVYLGHPSRDAQSEIWVGGLGHSSWRLRSPESRASRGFWLETGMLDIRWDYQESVVELVLGTGKFTNQSGLLVGQDPALGWARVVSVLCPSRPNTGELDATTKGGQGQFGKRPKQPKPL